MTDAAANGPQPDAPEPDEPAADQAAADEPAADHASADHAAADHAAAAPPEASDPRVVDAIRVPDWARRLYDELPPLARLFIGLTVLDVLGRSVGLLAPRIEFVDTTPLAFVASVLPHDLWILLPAIVVLRRPDAADVTPLVFRAAILLAVLELVATPLGAFFGYGTPTDAMISALLSIVHSGLELAGWVLLGRGLAALNPRQPSQAVAGLSNLVAASVAATIGIDFLELVAGPSFDLGDPGLTQLVAASSLLATFRLAGWAYLLWIVVRGVGDARRPPEATTTAAIGAALSGFLGLLAAIIGGIEIVMSRPLDAWVGSGAQDVLIVIYWFGWILGPTILLVTFALGLAEPPIPLPAAAHVPEPVTEASTT